MLGDMGRALLYAAGILALVGLVLVWGDKLPFLGRLPGDIRIENENVSFHFPLATSLLISLVLTIVINIVLRLFRR